MKFSTIIIYDFIRDRFWRILWFFRGFNDQIVFSGGRSVRGVNELIINEVINNCITKLEITPQDILLDIGVSLAFSKSMVNLVRCYRGIDWSRSTVKKINSNLSNFSNMIVVCGEAEAIPFSDNLFSKVVCNSIFMYIFGKGKIKKVLKEIHRVSQNGALVLIGDLDFKDKKALFLSPFHYYCKKNIFFPIKVFKIIKEVLGEVFSLRNKLFQKELISLVSEVGKDISVFQNNLDPPEEKYDIVFKVVK